MKFRRRSAAAPRVHRDHGFAWLPKRMRSGTFLWLERYRRDTYYSKGSRVDELDFARRHPFLYLGIGVAVMFAAVAVLVLAGVAIQEVPSL